MKKVLFILLSCFLVLGACGNNDKNTEKVSEDKPQFKNDTLVLDQAVLKIDDTFILNDKDSGDKLLAFKYHVKNKSDSEDITSMNVWIACFEATQDSDNTVNKLDVGITPTTGKLGEWNEHSNDTIKKGKTTKGIMTYKLQNDEDVVLKATKGADGKKLGTKKIKLDDLKSEDYSVTEDLTDNSKKDNKSEDNDSKNVASAKSDDNTSKESKTEDGKTTSDSNNNSLSTTNDQQVNNQPSNAQETPPTTHDESQMGYGRGDYEQARKDSEKVWNDPNAHVGGPRWVGKNEGYESWAKRQQEVQNTPAE
ncbi:DUF5067 domain-containing protein [Staphylococcus lugdunensis]|uniref:DUF5067 domain-containing protein n=1 Tax=Staphylococcus lugdunensis TaxID=28035 RepID=UPI000299309B|nr:DUF5067 domain-containing protein [Staphylococcus lugdunensis]MCG1271846.1 DUF5067 domain-containing protein [Staphylococcus epidermidis]EKS23783.1 hypothetical protein HMPREF9308_01467 [Staphylococcus lugdunensis ACS-027-V-Sch2]MCG1905474.1 DUF5067 domain-containing protein [Staphylococcus epidermidis]MCG1911724.1 DUF5067 domain-containing protein [Staphylococcus epidermidis]MCI2764779.1 DUF5067 domain-containing protein [Staphylococcus lugdunensis]